MNKLKVEIVTPSGKVFDGEVESITLPGADGEFGVLSGHSALVSLLKAGLIEIKVDSTHIETVAVDWGFAKVNKEKVTVLVDGAVVIKGTNESQIAKALDAAKELLRSAHDSNILLSTVEAKIEATAKGLL